MKRILDHMFVLVCSVVVNDANRCFIKDCVSHASYRCRTLKTVFSSKNLQQKQKTKNQKQKLIYLNFSPKEHLFR